MGTILYLVGLVCAVLAAVSYTHLDVYKRQHVERFLAQAAAAAFGAARLARVARLHHAELNLAPFAVDVFEEAVQTVEVFVARPQQALLFGRQFVVCLLYTSRCV